jgi:protein-S-isoprenylcysteine O-methyltransferase Ste14
MRFVTLDDRGLDAGMAMPVSCGRCRRKAMIRLHPAELATAALAAFFAIELLLREGSAARSWKATVSDRGSTMLIVAAYVVSGICLALPFPGPRFPLAVRWAGAFIAALGVVLRIVAFRSLGSSYSRTLRINVGQQLVMRGVYQRIRHPGYLSALLIWGGAVVASGSAIATIAVLTTLALAYSHRIGAEERMLVASFGPRYEEYRKVSWRLLPYIY